MNLDPALTPDDSGDSPGYQDRLGRGSNRMCAKLGLGGRCGACEEIVLVSELLG